MNPAEQGSGSAPKPRRRKVRRFFLGLLIFTIAGLIIFYLVCGMTYSEGTRSGVLVKISRKGYLFKTYEGELNIGGFNQGEGTIMPTSIFLFSVADKDTYRRLDSMQGRKIVVKYREVFHNFFWQGETNYFVEEAAYYR